MAGILAAVFLSSTFIINSLISVSGGHWAWTAALRGLFLLPVLSLFLLCKGGLMKTILHIWNSIFDFVIWGSIGFGLLYMTLAMASQWSPGWMVASTFQLNILAGILISPLIYKDNRRNIPIVSLFLSLIIVLGVVIIQLEKIQQMSATTEVMLAFLLVMAGAIGWPLGNRKIMLLLERKTVNFNAVQRLLGMTIGSLPLMILLSIVGFMSSGLPSLLQCQSSLYSAFFSGLIGGTVFYMATQLVARNSSALAAVEATQALEILFAFLGEAYFVHVNLPGFYARAGFIIVLCGLCIHFLNACGYFKPLKRWRQLIRLSR